MSMQPKLSVVTCLLLVVAAGILSAQPVVTNTPPGLKTAVLPLKDYTDNSRAYEPILASIYAGLGALEIPFVSSQELRPILRQHRIRAAGHVSPAGAAAIAHGTEADLLLVGSIDFYRDIDNLECGLSLRLVSPDDLTILSAVSFDATSRDQVGLFGAGTVDTIAALIPRVTGELLKHLYRPLLNPGGPKHAVNSNVRIVVLPFENISDDRHAGSIAANWLLSVLIDRGYTVVEPGAVIELLLPNGGLPVGQIDFPRLQFVRDDLEADLVITGEVDRFRPARTMSPSSKPEIEFGLRITDAANGLVLTTFNAEHDGAESETVFGLGRRHSLGMLTWASFEDAVKELRPQLVRFASEGN